MATITTFNGIPQRLQTATPLDLVAELINIHRLPGESLASFKERVLDVYVHPSNSSYVGLYNGIARELGVANYTGGIVIDVTRDGDGVPDSVTERCTAEVSNKYLTLKPDGDSGDVLQFDLHSRTDSFFLTDLLSNINNDTSIPFEVTTWGTATNWTKSQYLKKISSLQIENLNFGDSKLHTLYDSIPYGGGWIMDVLPSVESGIVQEASGISSSEEAVTDLNGAQYWIPDFERHFYTGEFATGTAYVQWQKFPLVIPVSGVSIAEYRDEEFLLLVSENQTAVDSSTTLGIPNVQGADYINELLSVVPMYWGK